MQALLDWGSAFGFSQELLSKDHCHRHRWLPVETDVLTKNRLKLQKNLKTLNLVNMYVCGLHLKYILARVPKTIIRLENEAKLAGLKRGVTITGG